MFSDLKILSYNGVDYSLLKIPSGKGSLYNIIDVKRKSTVFLDYFTESEVERNVNNFNRRIELFNSGFDYIETIELTDGFKRVKTIHKRIDGVDIYITNFGGRIVEAIGNKRHLCKDYVCSIHTNNISDVTDSAISSIVKTVNDKVNSDEN